MEKETVTITKEQWINLKKTATEIDEIAETLEKADFGLEIYDDLDKHSNNLWKQINQIDGIKW